MGVSPDWDRTSFTMDENLTKAVKRVFKTYYDKGLIYKGERMVNWCPFCNTSISDAEVEYSEEPSHLWHIKYKVADEDRYLIVATTRPETMLGDTAVAVNPEDERYKDIIGKTLILPLVGREIKVIADEYSVVSLDGIHNKYFNRQDNIEFLAQIGNVTSVFTTVSFNII